MTNNQFDPTSFVVKFAKKLLILTLVIISLDILLRILNYFAGGEFSSCTTGISFESFPILITSLVVFSQSNLFLPAVALNVLAQIVLIFSNLINIRIRRIFVITLGTMTVSLGFLRYSTEVCGNINSHLPFQVNSQLLGAGFGLTVLSIVLISAFVNLFFQFSFLTRKSQNG